jgi:hypothetical protein
MTRELSVRQWRALGARVAEKACRTTVPSVGARMVLQSLIARLAAGEEPPAQPLFADAMGISERTLRRHLAELRDCGFVFVTANGRAGATYDVYAERVMSWAKGELELELEPESGRGWPDNGAEGGHGWPDSEDEAGQDDRVLPRARGNAPPPPVLPAPSPPVAGAPSAPVTAPEAASRALAEAERAVAASHDMETRLKTAVKILRSGGVPMPWTNQQLLRGYLERGIQLEDVDYVALHAGKANTKRFDYCETIFDRLLEEAEEAGIRRLGDYRGVRPWTG